MESESWSCMYDGEPSLFVLSREAGDSMIRITYKSVLPPLAVSFNVAKIDKLSKEKLELEAGICLTFDVEDNGAIKVIFEDDGVCSHVSTTICELLSELSEDESSESNHASPLSAVAPTHVRLYDCPTGPATHDVDVVDEGTRKEAGKEPSSNVPPVLDTDEPAVASANSAPDNSIEDEVVTLATGVVRLVFYGLLVVNTVLLCVYIFGFAFNARVLTALRSGEKALRKAGYPEDCARSYDQDFRFLSSATDYNTSENPNSRPVVEYLYHGEPLDHETGEPAYANLPRDIQNIMGKYYAYTVATMVIFISLSTVVLFTCVGTNGGELAVLRIVVKSWCGVNNTDGKRALRIFYSWCCLKSILTPLFCLSSGCFSIWSCVNYRKVDSLLHPPECVDWCTIQ